MMMFGAFFLVYVGGAPALRFFQPVLSPHMERGRGLEQLPHQTPADSEGEEDDVDFWEFLKFEMVLIGVASIICLCAFVLIHAILKSIAKKKASLQTPLHVDTSTPNIVDASTPNIVDTSNATTTGV
eukprot:GEMP01090483.1.p2 GENE.GEMP01090483.1~~GEMP01090483.1.p2  ORF type:complete len:127 (+),score=39.43 GEMP01090483.1:170-550(+)